MIKIKMIIGMLVVIGTTAACVPAPDETYCTDIDDIQKAVEQYAEVDRVSVKNEVLEDLNEMGAQNRCPGYSMQDQDKD